MSKLDQLASAAGLRPALNLVPARGSIAALGLYSHFDRIPYPKYLSHACKIEGTGILSSGLIPTLTFYGGGGD